MKTLRLWLLAAALLLSTVSAQEQQQQIAFLPDDDVIPIPEQTVLDLATQSDKDPVPPPIWTLCGDPAKHLLIPYPPSHLLPGSH
jgi:hypothetical protein